MVERSTAVEVGPIKLRLPSPEDLIILKAVAHRPKDIADIQATIHPAPNPLVRIKYATRTLCGCFHYDSGWHIVVGEGSRYVVEVHLWIDLEGRSVELSPRQGFSVAKGVLHRTRAPEKTVVLMIEGAGVKPTGNE